MMGSSGMLGGLNRPRFACQLIEVGATALCRLGPRDRPRRAEAFDRAYFGWPESVESPCKGRLPKRAHPIYRRRATIGLGNKIQQIHDYDDVGRQVETIARPIMMLAHK